MKRLLSPVFALVKFRSDYFLASPARDWQRAEYRSLNRGQPLARELIKA